MEKNQNYFLGLDIGTNSVGYAVVDENYGIVRAKGKDFWGVRLFEKAEQAKDRRAKRTQRRRLERRELRLSFLKDIFKDEIEKVDPKFFTRLKCSAYREEDKENSILNEYTKNSIFNGVMNGEKYTDKEYFNNYKTIYHLREELTREPAKDIRLLYLACHNIIKRRGHFLFENEFGDNVKLTDAINNLSLYVDGEYIKNFDFQVIENTEKNEDELIKIAQSGKRDGKIKIVEFLCANEKASKLLAESFISGSINAIDIFADVEKEDNKKIDLGSETYQADCDELGLTDEQQLFLDKVKDIYNLFVLKKLLGKYEYICSAKVNAYNEHGKQLKQLKGFIKKYYKSQYYDLFRNPNKKITGYSQYVDSVSTNGRKFPVTQVVSDRTRENFYKDLEKIIKSEPEIDVSNDENYVILKNKILRKIENQTYLLKQRVKENNVFPYQLYLKELKKILEVSATKYAFLNDKDEYGTNIDKILQILSFRVPYFVGPLIFDKKKREDKEYNKFAWAEIKDDSLPYRPWTLDKIVDYDESEKKFIERMTSKCTYLIAEDVLPKNSLIYKKFVLLNEINCLRINGVKISVELKQEIFNELFKKYKKVTKKKLVDYLVNTGKISKDDVKDIVISGIDKEFINDYSVYYNLCNLIGQDLVDNNGDVIEDIIFRHTLMEDKSRFAEYVKNKYSDVFTEGLQKKIKSLSYQKWGKLSKKFLTQISITNKNTGEVFANVIDALWKENVNLQELLDSGNYDLSNQLKREKNKLLKDLSYADIDELYLSPAVKRATNQAIKIIKEVVSVMGEMPKKIFVEVTRHDEEKGEKGRKDSRKKLIEKKYGEIKTAVNKFGVDLKSLKEDLKNDKITDLSLRGKKLYLYFMQLGKCMYSGEPISLTSLLLGSGDYDVDHIIPQSKLKDDSFNNLALVKSNLNKAKGNDYPISIKHGDWIAKNKDFWRYLLDNDFITSEKFNRLTRTELLTEQDEIGFINRQIVETNQSVKAVLDLIKNCADVDSKTQVVYSKSMLVSNFRNKFDIYKCREINDLHHAKDAYLNVVVGNIYHERFTADVKAHYSKIKKNINGEDATINFDKILERRVHSFKDWDTIIWDIKRDLEKVKSVCEKNTCLVSQMPYFKFDGAFYDETVYMSVDNLESTKAKISLKGESSPLSNIQKYGGYNSLCNAYFVVIEYTDRNGEIVRCIEPVSVYDYQKYKDVKNADEMILENIVNENKLQNARYVLDNGKPIKLGFKSTFLLGKGKYWLGGLSDDYYVMHNGNQCYFNNEQIGYLKGLYKYQQLAKNNATFDKSENIIVISRANNNDKEYKDSKEIVLTREKNVQIYDYILDKLGSEIYKEKQLGSVLLLKMQSYREEFTLLEIEEESKALIDVLKGIMTGASNAIINGKVCGKIRVAKKYKKAIILHNSVTGIFERKVKI